ncbi:MAG: hydrogenase formation protein HypD [Pyrobaculum arsenaticum]|uniref:Hydrogenase formation protein HypD n=2 Tax=Pyrobaculum arsenaticum TaxID=121277 RepID=A0A7L4PBC5_9CREN|nr:hydrogenase formation protein HypD [Pyrobaculum arsenaticum]MCY0891364.1 hydrogenase formation protein HypD [Pyrobaculum arsenaticum]NYR15430.1 hydrogenase formation protein HypD [Pyrobaculum arsenaticum]
MSCVSLPTDFPVAPMLDCWKCPVMKREIAAIEQAFRRKTAVTSTLIRSIKKYSEELKARDPGYVYKIMDFCGTHEWTIVHFGLRSLLKKAGVDNVELVAGPGCPVCVTPSYYIEQAIKLALEGVVIYTYGDVYKLPALRPVKGARSLAEARALGGDVRIVHSFLHAILDARKHAKPSAFVGIGFETVAPGYSEAILKGLVPNHLKLMSLVKLTPPAMFYTLEVVREKPTDFPISGVIAPGHVSTIVGGKAWRPVAEQFEIPVVVAGFEPNDVLTAVAEILRQLAKGEHKVVIEYTRAVTWEGDLKAQSSIRTVFETVDSAWRGIGYIPKSGLALRDEFKKHDALEHFGIPDLTPDTWRYDLPANCKCAEVNLGKAKPTDCPLFMKACTPDRPIGPCMVSVEGTCAIWARFGGGGLAEEIAKEIGVF